MIKETKIHNRLRRAVNRTILRRLPPCKEIVQIVSASIDRRLTLRERIVMKLHLVACKPCVRYMNQSQFLSNATHQLDEKTIEDAFSGKLSDEARQRIKAILEGSAG
jgi:hypothetical protein